MAHSFQSIWHCWKNNFFDSVIVSLTIHFSIFFICRLKKLFQGMPEAWTRLLMDAQISKKEQQQNPQAVIDALDFFTNKEPTNSKWLPYDMSKSSLLLLFLYLIAIMYQTAFIDDCSPRPSTGSSLAHSTSYSTSSLPHHYKNNVYSHQNHYHSIYLIPIEEKLFFR